MGLKNGKNYHWINLETYRKAQSQETRKSLTACAVFTYQIPRSSPGL